MPCRQPDEFEIGLNAQVIEQAMCSHCGSTRYPVPELFDGDGNPHLNILAANAASDANGVTLLA